ncbi:MAG: hypothetical protein Q7W05_00685 [Deltaproteobacteria bacterium]|nr:hypothetical protein [Deltaproteobacteria bacterium]
MKNTAMIAALFLLGGCISRDRTPEASVRCFWAAMARGDKEAVLRTQIYYEEGMTSEFIIVPGNIEWLYLDSLSTSYDNQLRARVYYQVVFKKKGHTKTTRYKTGTMAIKKDGKWMVGRPVGRQPKE